MNAMLSARFRQISSLRFRVFCLGALFSLASPPQPARPSEPELKPQVIRLNGKRPFSLFLPADLQISPAAQGLKRARFMARSPDGRIFATAMHDLSDNSEGAVYILDGFDRKSGKFSRVTPYLSNLRNPNSIAFYRDANGQDWFYLALTDRLVRYKFVAHEESPSSPPELLATYPAYGLSYKYGGWHLTRTIAFGQLHGRDLLFVTVGSSCNACEEKEEIRATLSVMDPDGKNQRILARGLRNAVGMRFVADKLYLTNMGTDHLGDDQPDDPMFALDAEKLATPEPLNYGWPRCYYSNGKATPDPRFTTQAARSDCENAPDAFASFAAHSSPLGLEYFGSGFVQPLLRNYFLVALHGASNKKLPRGYRVVRVNDGGEVQDFITGFIQQGIIRGRPCDILKLDENSFLMSDDVAGVIYYIRSR
jgi:glucose/arabinose dehydrogenase